MNGKEYCAYFHNAGFLSKGTEEKIFVINSNADMGREDVVVVGLIEDGHEVMLVKSGLARKWIANAKSGEGKYFLFPLSGIVSVSRSRVRVGERQVYVFENLEFLERGGIRCKGGQYNPISIPGPIGAKYSQRMEKVLKAKKPERASDGDYLKAAKKPVAEDCEDCEAGMCSTHSSAPSTPKGAKGKEAKELKPKENGAVKGGLNPTPTERKIKVVEDVLAKGGSWADIEERAQRDREEKESAKKGKDRVVVKAEASRPEGAANGVAREATPVRGDKRNAKAGVGRAVSVPALKDEGSSDTDSNDFEVAAGSDGDRPLSQ